MRASIIDALLKRLHDAYEISASVIVGNIRWLKSSKRCADKPGEMFGEFWLIVLNFVPKCTFDQIAPSFRRIANQNVGIARNRKPVKVKE